VLACGLALAQDKPTRTRRVTRNGGSRPATLAVAGAIDARRPARHCSSDEIAHGRPAAVAALQ